MRKSVRVTWSDSRRGEKHWHGATPKTAITHIAIQEKKDGKVVDWMEHVTEQQYRKPRVGHRNRAEGNQPHEGVSAKAW